MNNDKNRSRSFYKVINRKIGDIGIVMTRKTLMAKNSPEKYIIEPTYNECVIKGVKHYYNYLNNDSDYERDYNHDDYDIIYLDSYVFTINNNKWNDDEIDNYIDYTYELKNGIINLDTYQYTINEEFINNSEINEHLDYLYKMRDNIIYHIKQEYYRKQQKEVYKLFLQDNMYHKLCSLSYNRHNKRHCCMFR